MKYLEIITGIIVGAIALIAVCAFLISIFGRNTEDNDKRIKGREYFKMDKK